MLKRIKNLRKGTLAGISGSIYILLIFPEYLQVAAATHNEAKWFCCVGAIVIAVAHLVWMGVTAFQQLDNALTKHKPPTYTPSDAKPSRFSIYFSVAAALAFVVFMLPLGMHGLVKAIKADNTLLITSSIFLITLAVWATIKHTTTLKKRGVKGWIYENTRLRKV